MRIVREILRFRLWAQIRSWILRAIFRPLTSESVARPVRPDEEGAAGAQGGARMPCVCIVHCACACACAWAIAHVCVCVCVCVCFHACSKLVISRRIEHAHWTDPHSRLMKMECTRGRALIPSARRLPHSPPRASSCLHMRATRAKGSPLCVSWTYPRWTDRGCLPVSRVSHCKSG